MKKFKRTEKSGKTSSMCRITVSDTVKISVQPRVICRKYNFH